MPTIAMFLGILIKMNYKDDSEHHLPHFHAIYNDFQAVFTLNGDLLTGNFPTRQKAFIKAWALLHEDELTANWTLAVNGEETFKIDPLR